MENMRFKVGDKVRIKSLDWYNENKDKNGHVKCGTATFDVNMQIYCGSITTIYAVDEIGYDLDVDWGQNVWTDEMIEGLVEEEVFIKANDIYNEEYSKGEYCHEQSFKWGFQEGYNYSHENDKLEISLKEGYQFKDENGNVINATKIVLEKKKKEYPKTYEECCKVLGYDDRETYCIFHTGADERLFDALYRLKVCRDAYWKIAGDEMGLDGSWEPDWNDEEQDKYGFHNDVQYTIINSATFVFPTEEMRDAFYENFDPDIEICKKLL
jgi:hypothetical protein